MRDIIIKYTNFLKKHCSQNSLKPVSNGLNTSLEWEKEEYQKYYSVRKCKVREHTETMESIVYEVFWDPWLRSAADKEEWRQKLKMAKARFGLTAAQEFNELLSCCTLYFF